jgi:hypothetical protein
VKDYLYKCQKHEDEGEAYSADEILNVVIVMVNPKKLHSENIDDQTAKPILHVCYIKDIDTIRNLLICPKCKVYCVQKHRYKDVSKTTKSISQYYKHVSECDGKRPDKILKTNPQEFPHAPGTWNNRTYLQLKSNKMLDQWKPDRYYIVYDLETVEKYLVDNSDIINKLIQRSENDKEIIRMETELKTNDISFETFRSIKEFELEQLKQEYDECEDENDKKKIDILYQIKKKQCDALRKKKELGDAMKDKGLPNSLKGYTEYSGTLSPISVAACYHTKL